MGADRKQAAPAGPVRPDVATSRCRAAGGLLDLQRSAGNAAVTRLVSGRGPTPPKARPGPVVQRAYWEKVGTQYVWHGGDAQPPKGHVELNEPQRANPKNPKSLYGVYGAPPKSSPKKNKKKGGGAAVVPVAKVGGPAALKRPQAVTQAKKAPILMEEAEAQALAAAKEMGRAASADVAVAAAKAAETAAALSRASADELGVLLGKVAAFVDIAADVRLHHTPALAAVDAASRFAAQARRLADVVEAQAKVKDLAGKEEAEKAKLKAAEKLVVELGQEIEYLQGYLAAFSVDMAHVGAGGFTPNVDLGEERVAIQLGIVSATRDRHDAEQAVADLEEGLRQVGGEKALASDEVPVKELAATTGSGGLAEHRTDLEATRALRGLAGGEANLSTLLALPRFTADKATLRLYLDALDGTALKPVQVVQLLSDLAATRTEVELATLGKAVAGGADAAVVSALAKVDPKVTAEHVALFAEVQKAAACKLQVVLDLLPVRAVALYASPPVLTELAVLAKGGTSATRMAEVIAAEPTLPKAALVELTNLFEDYTTTDEVLVLAKMIKEGMKAARTPAAVTKLIEDLKGDGVAVPPAAMVKLLLQADALAAFTMEQVAELMTALEGLTGPQIIEVSTWLSPLAAADKLSLITDAFVADGTAVDAIHGTFQVMRKARMDGTAIRAKVEYLRGYLAAPGGEADGSVTEVGGKKILTGPEIHAHAVNALTGATPHTKVAELNKYPKGENPATRNVDTLWLDADPTPRGPETAEEAVRRQKIAIAEICSLPDYIREHVQQLLAHNHGAAPRPIGLPAAEDALDPTASAHTNDKHTIGGGGSLNNYYALAARACYSPAARGQASAFRSPTNAREAIQAALDHYVAAGNWSFLREKLSKGSAVAFDRPVGTDKIVWLRTAGGGGPNGLYDRNGDGTFFNQAAKPKNDGGRGGRHYYPGDTGVIPSRNGFVTRSGANNALFETFGQTAPNQIPVEAATLTTVVPAAGVHLRLIGMNADGGFVVNSAYSS